MDFDKLIADIQAVMAEKHPLCVVSSVTGYGSYFYGGYMADESDIDIAVVITHEYASRKALKALTTWDVDLSITVKLNDDRFAVHVMTLDDLERHRKLTHTMKGKLLAQGEVLYENPKTRRRRAALQKQFASVPYSDAKKEYVDEWRQRALRLLRSSEQEFEDELMSYRTSSMQAAAVFALWSVLYEHDIDASPKAIRWHAGRLATIASMFKPSLTEIIPVAETIPNVHLRDQTESFSDDEYVKIIAAGKAVAMAVLSEVAA